MLSLLHQPRSDIPAITHVDYSARIQSVNRSTNPIYHRLIEAFKEETGFDPVRVFVADHVSRFYEIHGDRVNMVPVFGIEVDSISVSLSKEHCEFKWMDFETAKNTLIWNGQKEGITAVFDMLNSDDDRIRWSDVKIK